MLPANRMAVYATETAPLPLSEYLPTKNTKSAPIKGKSIGVKAGTSLVMLRSSYPAALYIDFEATATEGGSTCEALFGGTPHRLKQTGSSQSGGASFAITFVA